MNRLPKSRIYYYCDFCKEWHHDWKHQNKRYKVVSIDCLKCGHVYKNHKLKMEG